MAFTKDPDAVLDYAWDWTAWLADSETITSQEVAVPDDSGLTVGAVTQNGGVVTAWISGGTSATTAYAVVCSVVTNQGRTDERSLSLQVRDR